MQYLAQVSQPRGHHFYQKCHIYNPGGTILTKNVLFPTSNPGGRILIKYVLFTTQGAQFKSQFFTKDIVLPTPVVMILAKFLVLKYGTDVIPNLQTVVWLGLAESFVHNLALSFAHKHLCR